MKSPKPPDPYQTAQAQFGSELGAAGASSIMNNPNIYNPYGSQTYDIAGYETIKGPSGQDIQVPRYNQRQTLTPEEMAILRSDQATRTNLGATAQEQSAKMQSYLNQNIDPSKWQAWDAGPNAPKLTEAFRQDQAPTDRQAIENAMMAQYRRQADPREEAQRAQLAAQGAGAGTPIGQQAEQDLAISSPTPRNKPIWLQAASRAAQEAYNQVENMRNAVRASGFEMGGASADRRNALRGMQAQQEFALRNQPINEIMALMGGSQVNLPQFSSYQGQGINAPNLAGLIQQNYQTKAGNANATNAGLFGMGATILGGLAGGPMGAMLAGGAAKGLAG
jgi:hypothetical protein